MTTWKCCFVSTVGIRLFGFQLVEFAPRLRLHVMHHVAHRATAGALPRVRVDFQELHPDCDTSDLTLEPDLPVALTSTGLGGWFSAYMRNMAMVTRCNKYQPLKLT